MENTKICSKCGRELPLDCFSKDKRTKDGLFYWCKECVKQHHKQYYANHREEKLEYRKQHYQTHREEILKQQKQYKAEHAEEIAAYNKQWYAERYADNPEYYAYHIRWNNLQNDRRYGRCGKDEDPLAPLEYYIEKFTWGIDYYDEKWHHWSELGFDRIDDKLPHTIDNVIVATTEHNKDRYYKRMSVEEYKAYIQKQNEELELVL